MSELYLDLDGTLLDVRRRNWDVHRAVVRSLGAESALSLDTFWSHKRDGLTNARLLAVEGLAIDATVYRERFLDAIEADDAQLADTLLPGVDAALTELARTHELVVVTLRNEREPLLRSLARLGLGDRFAAVLSGSPLGVPGEHTKARMIQERGRHDGGDWLVGDTEIDVRAGKLLGLRTCAVTSGIRSEVLLRAEAPELVLSDLPAFAASRSRSSTAP